MNPLTLSWKVRLAIAVADRLAAYVEKHRKAAREAQAAEFAKRWEAFAKGEKVFLDEELRYSATSLCQCGHGLAYPKNVPFGAPEGRAWYCSAALKGIADAGEHDGPFPFTFWQVKSEDDGSAYGHTTRGATVHPKPGRVVKDA